MVKTLNELLQRAKAMPKKKIAVVAADDLEILKVVDQALKQNLASFMLIGDKSRIDSLIKMHQLNIHVEIVDEPDHKKAADLAVDFVVSQKCGAIMKGLIHSNLFLKAILNKEKGLNTGKPITQISVTESIEGDRLMMITDCAISIAPDVLSKKAIIENAVFLAHQLGNPLPKVAVLASIENVNTDMQETIDAAVLSKMGDRGQLGNCIVDGPFAFDNIVSKEAAHHKGIKSVVAGEADIILVPNLTVGNTLTKALTYMAKKQVVAATVGASIPIVFTSRTESIEGKLLSIALATLTA